MNFLEILKSGRVIVWDGGMGSSLVNKSNKFSKSTKLGEQTGCNEELNLTAPEIVQKNHENFLKAGAQVIETNTFGANRISLAEHGLADKVREINLAAVKIAKAALNTNPPSPPLKKGGKGGFISGSIGPTSKLPTLGHISFNEMVEVYREQAAALIEGGVDILQIETCQDILQAKAAVVGCKKSLSLRASAKQSSEHIGLPHPFGARNDDVIPIIVTITLETNGTTLLGTEIGAALAALAPLGISAFGLNCGTGPAEMEEAVRYLVKNSPLPVAVLPNAGLPEIKNGRACYNLSPDEFAKWAEYFVRELGVQIIGGCCGVMPEHIGAMVRWSYGAIVPSNYRTIELSNKIASLYTAISLDQEPRPLIIGERMNINGSKEFREHILADNFDAAATMAKRQADTGAHILDLSVAYAGRDEVADMNEMAKRLATASPLPLMIDSTNPSAVEAALTHLGGRAIINSINLEDGGKKAEKIIKLAVRFGSALVALTIDENGMALTSARKITVAKRIIKFCTEHGFNGPILIDPLTFTLADPKAAEFGSGRETLKAIKQIPSIPPLKKGGEGGGAILTILGVSNISYGFNPETRRVLNSVFLHEAVKAGLDAAIVHAGQIQPLHKIDKKAQELAKNLIFCRKKHALEEFLAYFDPSTAAPNSALQNGIKKRRLLGINIEHTQTSWSGSRDIDSKMVKKGPKTAKKEQDLKSKVVDGDKNGLNEAIELALKKYPASDIINKILLPAMQVVGERFGAGELVLPFVLQSAEVMRASVDILSPYLKKGEGGSRGTLVLATVRGDVHDIGKNLVDIILTNNGYRVINLGVKQPVDAIIRAAAGKKASAIGLSGLLVQSCLIMKEDLAEMAHRGINLPVICGGAALTRKFVESDLQKVYKGRVFYAKDAFDGLKIMTEITNDQAPRNK